MILLGWIAAITVVMVLIARPWKSAPAKHPLPWLLAALSAGWVLWWGADGYRDAMTEGRWTAASVTIGFVPLKALLYALLAYFAGRTLLGGARRTSKQWLLLAAFGLALAYLVASDVMNIRATTHVQHARDQHLSPAEIAGVIERIRTGKADQSEHAALLSNPLCPPEFLAESIAAPDVLLRSAVAANPKLDGALAEKLAGDPAEDVRYYLAFNRELAPALLTRLAGDQSELVRNAVAWTKALPDADFERLVNDPSPKVRATAALQQRISAEQLAKLKADPEERVRNAANRWQ